MRAAASSAFATLVRGFSGGSQRGRFCRLPKEDAAEELTGCLVDLKVRGRGVRVAEAPLERRAVIDCAAAGELADPHMTCHHCGGEIDARNVTPESGSGLRAREAAEALG
jgi:hypothetical protein